MWNIFLVEYSLKLVCTMFWTGLLVLWWSLKKIYNLFPKSRYSCLVCKTFSQILHPWVNLIYMLFTKLGDSLTLCIWNIFIKSSCRQFSAWITRSQRRHNYFLKIQISNNFELRLSMYFWYTTEKIYQGCKATDTSSTDNSDK